MSGTNLQISRRNAKEFIIFPNPDLKNNHSIHIKIKRKEKARSQSLNRLREVNEKARTSHQHSLIIFRF